MVMGSYLSLGATAPLCSRSSMSYGSDVHLMVVFPEHLASPLRQTQKSPHLTIFKHQLRTLPGGNDVESLEAALFRKPKLSKWYGFSYP